MLRLSPTAADRALAVASVALSIAACAALAVAFLMPFVGLLFPRHVPPPALIVLTGVVTMSSPLLAIAGVVCAHISRRLYPHVALGRIGLILGYSVLGLTALLVVLAVATWLTIGGR